MKTFKQFVNEVKEPTGGLKSACWTGYTAVGMKMKNGKKVPNCVPEETQRIDPSCWTGYKKQGTKMKSGVRVNNCVKEDGEGGAPANNVGAGNIAGTGGKAGEPGINLSGFGRKKKSPVIMPIRTRTPPKM